tara:strand:+ start:624 stop:1511 length:888 start_codon:yes stop_codon:yes gene_type:complete
MAKRYPVLDVYTSVDMIGPLSWSDAIAVAVDDHTPFAVDETQPNLIRIYFSSKNACEAANLAVSELHGSLVRTHTHWLSDEDWPSRSQACLQAIKVGRIIVAPPWDIPESSLTTDVLLEIRPALGFGSGHHATTRLALLALQELNLNGREVLDLGTGSGILAIASVKLGGRHALGIDRDPDAIQSAHDSVGDNDVTDRVELRVGDIADLSPSAASVVVANLTGTALVDMSPVIETLIEPEGYLVLTGILDFEESKITDVYLKRHRVIWRATEDEWVGLLLQRQDITHVTRLYLQG